MSGASESRFALLTTAAFVALAGWVAAHHEMWRDEIQAWLLARDSGSVRELLAHMKYEGHPALWHLCLLPLTRLTASPTAMQVLHLGFAAATVYLVARYGPFTRPQTLLFSGGYLFLYEYGVICRNYAPGVFLLCLCATLTRRRDRELPWPAAVVLFLACHTNVYVLIVVIALAGTLSVRRLLQRRVHTGEEACHGDPKLPAKLAIVFLGIATSAWQMVPPADSGFAVGWRTNYDDARARHVLGAVVRAYLPMPMPRRAFWNSHILEHPRAAGVRLAAAALIVGWVGVLLRRRPAALLFFLVSTGGLLAFYYAKHSGGIRHEGFLFVAFFLALWMFPQESASPAPGALAPAVALIDRTRRPVLTGLLGLHALGGMVAVGLDLRYQFSCGKETARFVRDRGLAGLPIVADPDYAAETVVGYLQKDCVCYPRADRHGSFIVWNTARLRHGADSEPLDDERIIAAAGAAGEDALLLLNRPLSPQALESCPIQQLACFGGSTVGDEQFFVYRYRPNKWRHSATARNRTLRASAVAR